MIENHRRGPDPGLVTAARAGDGRALEQLVAHCLPLVYNIVGRALNGHADVDDVVQETLLRMVRGLPKLRDPSAFRSWLVAITIRQVRNRESLRATDRDRRAQLEDAEVLADPDLDFAGLTILRLGLTEQRRETAEATRWLDPDDQELLSLWWLEETGELERADLAGALGLSDRHAAVRVQRMKKQMEVSRCVVRGLGADPRCARLDEIAAPWDGLPSPLWRKRFGRHIRGCSECAGLERGLLPMDRLLSGLPLLAVPASLDPARVLAHVTAASGTPGTSGTSALAASGASWYYTWNTQHQGVTTPGAASFVPMIWGAASVTDASLAQARAQGPYLLGFNEPDMAQQSNMTVEQALQLWPRLMGAGKVLGSPAVAYGADTAGGWLDRFMSGAKAKGYRVDFITLHWYGGDFRTPQAVQQLTSYLASVYERYHKPIWLTEYALIDFSQGTRFPSAQQQADFVTASAKALDALPYLQRYAWFGLGADPSKPSSGLFTNGTAATAAGRAFQSAR
ncbi:sigma-70 family RNA polymerase sigma factor [Streptomyces sp. NPDC054813]